MSGNNLISREVVFCRSNREYELILLRRKLDYGGYIAIRSYVYIKALALKLDICVFILCGIDGNRGLRDNNLRILTRNNAGKACALKTENNISNIYRLQCVVRAVYRCSNLCALTLWCCLATRWREGYAGGVEQLPRKLRGDGKCHLRPLCAIKEQSIIAHTADNSQRITRHRLWWYAGSE